MTISLNRESIEANGLTVDEALYLLVLYNNVNLQETELSLIPKGYITADRNELFKQIGWRLTAKGSEILENIILESDKNQKPVDKLTDLAFALKAIFPKGKKPGTNYYWADGVALIIRRLKLFFKKYGTLYTEEQIIKATEKYVNGFNGNYSYMRLLKYFIFKEKVGVAGDIEGDSELISYIENEGQEEELSDDWGITLK